MSAFEIFYYFALPTLILAASFIGRAALRRPAKKTAAPASASPPVVIVRIAPESFTWPRAANE